MSSLVNELNNLDFSTLIGGPIQAAVQAQNKAAIAQVFRQILIPMRINNMIVLDGINDMTDYINSLLRQLSLNEQLSTNINGAVASIGKADTVRLIATVLTEEI